MSRVNDRNNGFTLVELMLAMAFVSALLLAIAMTVIQIGNIYSRGLAFKNINQAGLTFSSAIQADINNSQLFDVGGSQARYLNTPGVGGRLCLGNYSYIWNYGVAINSSSPPPNINRYDDPTNTIVTFAKVPDPAAEYCKGGSAHVLRINKAAAINLLDSDQYNLAIHDIAVTSTTLGVDSKTKQGLYSVKITIGTNNALAIDYLATSGPTCRLPNDDNYDPLCYINTFNIVARAGNTIQ